MNSKPQTRAYLALALGISAISFSGIFIRWADAPGTVTSFYRLLFASLVLLPLVARQASATVKKIQKSWLIFPLLGGLFSALDHGIWAIALDTTSIATTTLLNNISPLWVALFTWLVWRARLPGRFWWGLALTLGGAAIVFGSDLWQQPAMSEGKVLAVLSSFAYAGYFLTGQRGRRYIATMPYLWMITASGAVFLLLWNLSQRLPLTGYTPITYATFLGAALFPQIIGHFFINYALGKLPAAIVAPTAVAQPVIAALLAIPLAQEYLGGAQLIGGIVTLAGIALVNSKAAPPVEAEPVDQAVTVGAR